MKFNLSNKEDATNAHIQLARLMIKKPVIEIREVKKRRSLSQNAFLHLLLGAFGLATGYTADESKTIFKREVNSDIFVYSKNGSKFLKSSADLSVDEMSKSIDRFRSYAGENGIELPLATDNDWLLRIENDMEKQGRYL